MTGRLFHVAAVLLLAAASHAHARGGGGCLREGTLVETPRGAMAIERLSAGDPVVAFDRGRFREGRVVATTRVDAGETIELSFPGATVVATATHPFAVGSGVYRAADRIRAGDTLFLGDRGALRPVPVLSVRRIPGAAVAYDLLVDRGGTFLAAGILVHNKGCFLPDTPILLPGGTRKPIRDVRPGDRVLAFREDGTLVYALVREILTVDADGHYAITTGRAELRATAEHPFFVGDGTYRTVEALAEGDTVYAFDGERLSPQAIRKITRVPGKVRVFNLRTDPPNTFFAAGVAVHNKGGGGGCFPAGTKIRTPGGERPIESLSEGMEVVAVGADGVPVAAAVRLRTGRLGAPIEITTDAGRLRVTPDHPLAVPEGAFRSAGELSPGDLVLTLRDGGTATATVLAVIRGFEEVPVFHLTVGEPHTFVADGFVVHNKGGGGGGSRSSGGSSGGSRGSGGSSTGNEWVAVIFLGTFCAIILIAVGKAVLRKKEQELDYLYGRGAIERKTQRTRKLLEFLARQEPTADPAALEARAREVFLKLQECWQAREYGPMEGLIVPFLFKEHCRQLAGMRSNHEINVLEGLKVENVDPVHVSWTDDPYRREFTVLVTARSRDWYKDDRSGTFLRGDKEPATFQEFWTFQYRQSGWLLLEIEQTKESDRLRKEDFVESFTDLQMEQVMGGPTGETGPEGPWRGKEAGRKAGKIERLLNFLVRTDRLWDREGMLATARQGFTDLVLSREAGVLSAEASARMFSDAAKDFQDALERQRGEGLSVEYRNFCVRKTDLVLVRNFTENRKDEYLARVYAHAQRIVKRNGEVV
ncbi:MAG: polymorphic toxin-type HINT domain-containing protein, partial [Candidatus Deferrimicrobiaceae bacterium]